MVRLIFFAALLALASPLSASAQTVPPSGGVTSLEISQSGVTLDVDPQKGVSVGGDAGPAGSLDAGVGPQGVNLNLRGNTLDVPVTTPAPQSQATGASPTPPPSGGTHAPATTPGKKNRAVSTPPAASASERKGLQPARETTAAADGPSAAPTSRKDRVNADRTAERTRSLGVPPFLDFVERVPRAVWAALGALGLIALVMWLMWVRGRRRLERNAYVDGETGLTNVVAFDTLLEQEWTRAVRYQRPLGLLLLDLEGADARGLRGAREAISERVREADTVAELSSSRFAVIAPEAAHGSIETMAHALEQSLEMVGVHARVGIGSRMESDRGPTDLVSRAAASLGEPLTADEEPVEHELAAVHAAA
jgi:GGDEF domain-containing protein